MKKVLSEERLNHSISTALFAEYLCAHYGVFAGSNKCFWAGFVHDIAREYGYKEIFGILKTEGENIENWERERPVLLHGKVGAIVLKNKFGIKDQEILNAVRDHVTGREGMGILSKIVFVADYLEPLRNFVLPIERKILLKKNLDNLVCFVLNEIFNYLKRVDKPIAPPALSLYRELKSVRT